MRYFFDTELEMPCDFQIDQNMARLKSCLKPGAVVLVEK